ncbi:tRNA lysidine(34) synthetase TilS [Nocardioides sp. ChNu-153]|uniref:tRNA lysidine(34) synthetase TilS n=1 Tax=unclassified Nocardioides TaxID=2615069 RepID=UPI0024072323|nr:MULTISPECIES: tRNA lysidine(34) synthetase TilS [unclassified Nocardioides]MDF9716258.1 tRNA lysidine(34) synthetase TilS [Nocardioides sp. ChNu-99]MDN7122000.1 tRNA lysidine(34) synthetase TilS [Nocardioides sp. ChNu-153]
MTLPPSLAAVRGAVRRELTAPGAAPPPVVVVACSGGADSLALLAATVFTCSRARDALDTRVVGVVVDHGLQEGSAEHTARVVEQMAALGADETFSARVQVSAGGLGVEAAAREARYAVLAEVAQRVDAPLVLLGHTLDDQAETVLLGLARGSGGRSIAGMRRRFEVFARPLLDVTRAETEEACRAEGIAWWDDPHNDDPRFLRSRVRRAVLPVLEAELNPRVRHNLARTADLLQDDLAALDELAAGLHRQAVRGTGLATQVDTAALPGVPRALVTRVLRRAALAAGASDAELFAVHVEALDRLASGPRGASTPLPGHVTAYRDGALLRFRPTPPADA